MPTQTLGIQELVERNGMDRYNPPPPKAKARMSHLVCVCEDAIFHARAVEKPLRFENIKVRVNGGIPKIASLSRKLCT